MTTPSPADLHYDWCAGDHTDLDEPCVSEWEGVEVDGHGSALVRRAGAVTQLAVYSDATGTEAIVSLDGDQCGAVAAELLDQDEWTTDAEVIVAGGSPTPSRLAEDIAAIIADGFGRSVIAPDLELATAIIRRVEIGTGGHVQDR